MSGGGLPRFVCPRCRGALARGGGEGGRSAGDGGEHYRCAPCAAAYPVVLGIPDFRVAPDPWIGLEEDREKARRLEAVTRGLGFEETVRAYWAMTPDTPPALAERFTAYVLGAEPRARRWLAALHAAEGDAPAGPWLEVGCGSGDLVAAAAAHGVTVVGVDVALRWLVAARKRPALARRAHQLVCCNGEHLPFADGAFARVVSVGTLEHCRDADAVVAEGRRVLQPAGVFRARTVNRFTLLPEPHVDVWGVGLVPRRWADPYVRWRSGRRYLHHRPLSGRELRRGLRRAGFADVRVAPAPLLDAERLPDAMRWAAPLYERLRRLPVVRAGLGWVAPLLEARGVAA